MKSWVKIWEQGVSARSHTYTIETRLRMDKGAEWIFLRPGCRHGRLSTENQCQRYLHNIFWDYFWHKPIIYLLCIERADCLGEQDKHRAERALVFQSNNAHQLRAHRPCESVCAFAPVGYLSRGQWSQSRPVGDLSRNRKFDVFVKMEILS